MENNRRPYKESGYIKTLKACFIGNKELSMRFLLLLKDIPTLHFNRSYKAGCPITFFTCGTAYFSMLLLYFLMNPNGCLHAVTHGDGYLFRVGDDISGSKDVFDIRHLGSGVYKNVLVFV